MLRIVAGVCAGLVSSTLFAADLPATLVIRADKPGPAIGPNFFGLMTEEINHAYDGGLYAELIRNRTFQDADQPQHWSLVQDAGGRAEISLTHDNPVNDALPVSLKLSLNGGRAGVANDGFWGIPVKPATTYTISYYAKAADGFTGPVTAALVGDDGKNYVSISVSPVSGEWKKYTAKVTTPADITATSHAKFVLSAEGNGSVYFSLVSLFPPTYQDRPNGLRADLVEKMQALKPTFLRFPGGNYLEGDTIATRFDWKKQIGPIDQRPGHMGCWGYRSSDGLGMPEFLHWCRAINAEPVLGVYAGYSLKGEFVPAGPDLQKYVDEALEEIEYVTGGPETKWGARRIADGNPEPFKLRYVEVGNEDWFDRSGSYDGRFAQFYDAIKAKYPDIQVISTMPVKSRKADIQDDHYYMQPRTLARNAARYDKTDRNGPKIFIGEWASQDGRPTPTLHSALGDAAFIIGLEKNADLIPLTCYAPLFVNVNPGASQWGTNLIGYDALGSFGSPSYYAQVMLAENKGDLSVPTELKVEAPPVQNNNAGAVGIGTWLTQAEFKDLTVTAKDGKTLLTNATQSLDGWRTGNGKWSAADGVILQVSGDAGCTSYVGDPAWTDYTLRVKAKKTGGDEGFLVAVRAADEGNFVWWNIGGWGNTRTAIEASVDGDRHEVGRSVNTTVEADRWYDLRVEVSGRQLKCYIDDKLISQATLPGAAPQPVFAGATYDKSAGEVVLKVVNMTNDAVATGVSLAGVKEIASTGRGYVLTGESLKDVNNLQEPTKVAPKAIDVDGLGESFKRTFPARSLTVLRIKARL
ncbi:MAG: alpha-L-arabinofuranosidase C-terminal domain-containing protein [Tepidisphaeraceae bacterium]